MFFIMHACRFPSGSIRNGFVSLYREVNNNRWNGARLIRTLLRIVYNRQNKLVSTRICTRITFCRGGSLFATKSDPAGPIIAAKNDPAGSLLFYPDEYLHDTTLSAVRPAWRQSRCQRTTASYDTVVSAHPRALSTAPYVDGAGITRESTFGSADARKPCSVRATHTGTFSVPILR